MMEFKQFNRETGIAGATFVVLLGMSLLPQFTILVIWLLPVPIVAFAVLQSRISAALLSILSGLVLIFTGFGWFALLLAIAFYFLAWTVGDVISKGNSPFIGVVAFTLVFIMLELVLLALFRWSGFDLFSSLQSQLSRSLAAESSLLGQGVSPDALLTQTLTWIKMMFPALVSISAILIALLNLLLLRWLLRAQFVVTPILRNWKLPYSVLIVYMLSLALILLGAFHTVPWLWQSLHNLEFLGSFVIGLQGLAFIWRKLQAFRARHVILLLLVFLSILQLVSMVYVVLGVLDILNERRRHRQI